MEIRLTPKHPRIEAANITSAQSLEFAELLRSMEVGDRIEGHFILSREKGRGLVLELEEER